LLSGGVSVPTNAKDAIFLLHTPDQERSVDLSVFSYLHIFTSSCQQYRKTKLAESQDDENEEVREKIVSCLSEMIVKEGR
jgi:hypothetical protein